MKSCGIAWGDDLNIFMNFRENGNTKQNET